MKFLNINDFFRSDKNYCMFLNHICPPLKMEDLSCHLQWEHIVEALGCTFSSCNFLTWSATYLTICCDRTKVERVPMQLAKVFFSGILLIFTLLKKRTGPFLILVPRIFCRLRKPSNLLDPALFQTHKIGASPLCKAKDKSATKKLSPQCYEQLNKVSRNQQGYLSM